MTLTLGSGPFASSRRGTLNVDLAAAAPKHILFLDPTDKRIRYVVDGTTVIDSRRAQLLHESHYLPRYYVPREDVLDDALVPSDTSTHCPFKGDARYWTLKVGDVELPDAVWAYPEPLEQTPDGLGDLVCLDHDPSAEVGQWFEEEQPMVGHPRDPYHRVDTRESSDEVVVRVGGREIARSTAPVKLFETGLPPRWYLPRAHVDAAVLHPSGTETHCPYKGDASYYSITVDGTTVGDGAFYYPYPLGESLQVANMLCLLGEGIETTVDGEPAPGS